MPLGISKNLFLRIASALLLLPPVLAVLYYGSWWFVGLLVVGGAFMSLEWSRLTISDRWAPGVLLACIVTILLIVSKQHAVTAWDFILIGLALTVFAYGLIRFSIMGKAGWLLFGIAYVGLPLLSMWWLRVEHGLFVLWVFLIVWGTDIGGYFAGKGIGGPKLAPTISPKKTWSGLIGGMALSTAASVILVAVTDFVPSMIAVAIVSALMAVWAQVGDLVESGIKRSFDVKDSGGLIPGHGGVLDRVDGLVFVAPAIALLLETYPSLLGTN